jgi:hypothetical protein
MIRIRCPKCEALLRIDSSRLGTIVDCPRCHFRFQIAPAPASPAPSSSATRASNPSPRGNDETDGSTAIRERRNPSAIRKGEVRGPETLRRERFSEDRDEVDDEDEELERRRRRKKKKKKRRRSGGFAIDNFNMLLLAVAGVWLVFLLLAFVAPAFALVLNFVGSLVMLASVIWFLIVAFQDSATAGICSFLCGIYLIFFLITHWEEEKRPFFAWLIGLGMALSAFFVLPAEIAGPQPRR